MFLSPGKLNNIPVTCLRDPGATISIAKQNYVSPSQLTDRYISLKLINGYICRHRLALIEVDTDYFKGELEACVMPNPVYDLILGNNVPDSLNPKVALASQQERVLAVTRNQKARSSEVAGSRRKLRIDDVGEMLRNPRLQELQTEDSSLNNCFEHARTGQEKRQGSFVSSFLVKDNLLFRKVCRKDHPQQVAFQLAVPQEYRQMIFKLGHSSPLSGHTGKAKTLGRIMKQFYWPNIYRDVTLWTASCDVCQRTTDKGRIATAPIQPLPVIGEPFQRCAIDLIGPIIPASAGGYKYALVLTDFATKWPEAVPLRSISTEAVATALLGIFTRLGVPKEILSDRGTQFTSAMMTEVYRLMSIKGLTTTPYHPQSNGACERLNGVLKKMLKRLCIEQPQQWHKFINPLLFAYREVEHKGTGFSPFYLMYGRDVRGPMQILRESLEGKVPQDEETQTAYKYVLELQERLQQTYSIAQEELRKAGISSADYIGKKARLRKLEEGDQVLLLLPTSSNKLLAHWQGPYEVRKKVSDLNYIISVDGKEKMYHINMLKVYQTQNFQNSANSLQEAEKDRGRRDLLGLVEQSFDSQVTGAAIQENEEPGQLQVLATRQEESFRDVVIAAELSPSQGSSLSSLCEKYASIFTDKPPKAKVEPYKIIRTDNNPVRSRPYSIPHRLKDKVEAEVRSMERDGYLEPAESPYSSPMVVVRKPDGSIRICGDYRKLNAHIQFDAEPMADQHDIFSRLSNSRVFSKMDLAKGFYQLPLDRESRPLTAMATPLGLKQYTVVPFGLSISPAVFNRTLRRILKSVSGVEIFMDDILVHSPTWEEHVETLRKVFEVFHEYRISVKPSKCELGSTGVEFLGHFIGEGVQKPQERTLEKIRKFAIPATKREVQSLLGLCNYYSEFIKDYTYLAQPLIELTKKNMPEKVVWCKRLDDAFRALKDALCAGPILQLPDVTKPFILQTDASSSGIGAVLMQEIDGFKRPVLFWSRKLKAAEINYATVEKECLAVVEGIRKFKTYLYGDKFILETDHQPLSFLKNYSSSGNGKNGRLVRWALFLQDYKFVVKYIPGSENSTADYLSREGTSRC